MIDTQTLRVILVVVISYLLGSLPTAYIVARQKGVNIFEVGSGNMGATNVIRALGLWWGVLVWLFDSLKGVFAILIARLIWSENTFAAAAVAAIVAIIGHNWSLFATMVTGTLRGGKGAACAFGTMLLIAPLQVIVVMTVVGGFIVALTRYVSLAVLVMFGLGTAWMIILFTQHQIHLEYMFYSVALASLLLIRFRENIQRLLQGTERRLGDRA
jgi:glycerol-3-phosphate acyltransferase PlsY